MGVYGVDALSVWQKVSAVHLITDHYLESFPRNMPARKKVCTCKECKLWSYKDDHGIVREGRLLSPDRVLRHSRREQYRAAQWQAEGAAHDLLTLPPEAAVLLATITDRSSTQFEQSVAVRPRDEDDADVHAPDLEVRVMILRRYSDVHHSCRMAKVLIEVIRSKELSKNLLRSLHPQPQSSPEALSRSDDITISCCVLC